MDLMTVVVIDEQMAVPVEGIRAVYGSAQYQRLDRWLVQSSFSFVDFSNVDENSFYI